AQLALAARWHQVVGAVQLGATLLQEQVGLRDDPYRNPLIVDDRDGAHTVLFDQPDQELELGLRPRDVDVPRHEVGHGSVAGKRAHDPARSEIRTGTSDLWSRSWDTAPITRLAASPIRLDPVTIRSAFHSSATRARVAATGPAGAIILSAATPA